MSSSLFDEIVLNLNYLMDMGASNYDLDYINRCILERLRVLQREADIPRIKNDIRRRLEQLPLHRLDELATIEFRYTDIENLSRDTLIGYMMEDFDFYDGEFPIEQYEREEVPAPPQPRYDPNVMIFSGIYPHAPGNANPYVPDTFDF